MSGLHIKRWSLLLYLLLYVFVSSLLRYYFKNIKLKRIKVLLQSRPLETHPLGLKSNTMLTVTKQGGKKGLYIRIPFQSLTGSSADCHSIVDLQRYSIQLKYMDCTNLISLTYLIQCTFSSFTSIWTKSYSVYFNSILLDREIIALPDSAHIVTWHAYF